MNESMKTYCRKGSKQPFTVGYFWPEPQGKHALSFPWLQHISEDASTWKAWEHSSAGVHPEFPRMQLRVASFYQHSQ